MPKTARKEAIRPVPLVVEDLEEDDLQELSSSLVTALLSSAPRPLVDLEGELLMFAGQYLYHYTQDGVERYKFLSPSSLKAAFAAQPTDSGWLPPGVVRWGENIRGEYVVYFIPACHHTFQLQAMDGKEDVLVRVALPSLVLAGLGREWYVWAVQGHSFDPQATMYAAPLPNVGGSGRICWGENQAPVASGKSAREAWRLFIESPFNDHESDGKSKGMAQVITPGKDDIRSLLFLMAEEGAEEYPLQDLKPMFAGSEQVSVVYAVHKLLVSRGGDD